MVTLVIEDGTGVIGANTFVSAADATQYASDRGLTLPADPNALAELLIQATDFLLTYENRMSGERLFPLTQELCYPRTCVELYGQPLLDGTIPPHLKSAQIQIAVAANSGIVLFPTQSDANIVRETIGPLTTEYDATTWSPGDLPLISAAESLLQPLFANGGGFYTTVRV